MHASSGADSAAHFSAQPPCAASAAHSNGAASAARSNGAASAAHSNGAIPSLDGSLPSFDPEIQTLIDAEEHRQRHKIILIASESFCPKPVREALTASLGHLYAEGYPGTRMSRDERDELTDVARHLSFHRRYTDRRYYKGCEYANFIESVAQQRVAACFANERVRAHDIYANVQPLSGAAANNAVYQAFVPAGAVVMGLALNSGGHLTHGSSVNRSGRTYKIVHYGIDKKTGRLDYDRIRALALEHRPRMLIAGFSAYPWEIDWQTLRSICDAVPGGPSILMADISHPAGLVIAGRFPNPVGIADVTTFTTHKTLCGPRGAVILTTRADHAKKIDFAVFPGEQGGPHLNQIAAKAVAFRIAQSPEFRTLQNRVADNALALADGLLKRGLKLAYGGTNSHLCLIDLNALKPKSGPPVRGSIASNLLDLCGITVNKNTIAGDSNAVHPSAIRLGTMMVSQRGMGPAHMDRIAELIHRALSSLETFEVPGARGAIARGKIAPEVLRSIREDVAKLISEADGQMVTPELGYPHYGTTLKATPEATPFVAEFERSGGASAMIGGWRAPLHAGKPEAELEAARKGAVLCDHGQAGIVEVRGERARAFLNGVGARNLSTPKPGTVQSLPVCRPDGTLLDDALLVEPVSGDRFLVLVHGENAAELLATWRDLSDGYITLSAGDLFAKVDGPAVIEDLRTAEGETRRRTIIGLYGPKAHEVLKRLDAPGLGALAVGQFCETTIDKQPVRVLRPGTRLGVEYLAILVHPAVAAKVWAAIMTTGRAVGLAPAGDSTAKALRKAAGLPLYGAGSAPVRATSCAALKESIDLSKPFFVGQTALAAEAPKAAAKPVWKLAPAEGPLRRTSLYKEHTSLTKKKNLIPFAGWEMPVLYETIGHEHHTVRAAAGLFDVSHMGVLELRGPGAARFLDLVSTNSVPRTRVGQSHYGYVLDPEGRVLDDIIIYRRGPEKFMVVVNASNADKIFAWWNAVNRREVTIDPEAPWREIDVGTDLRDLKDPSCGAESRVDLALQGRQAIPILRRLGAGFHDVARLDSLGRFELLETTWSGFDIIVSRTGYTGEEYGYELFVHPDRAPELWKKLLELGADLGLKPAGLGARDSLRTEAGFPLYGHELAGKHDITPNEAGYGQFVRRHKPFFIGRAATLRREAASTRTVVRFRMTEKGIKVVHPGDMVVSKKGTVIGSVTSCTLVGETQLGLALVEREFGKEGTPLGVFYQPREGKKAEEKPKHELAVGDRVQLHEEAVVLSRFPKFQDLMPVTPG